MYIELKRRSILKTISWRVWATLSTAIIVFLFTGDFLLSLSVGGVEVIAKLVLYFMHERLWNRIRFGKKEIEPFVLWFTGLSGAGKSTLADLVYADLAKRGLRVERLDGDVIRSVFPKTGFNKEDRDNHIKRVGFLASLLEKNGVIVISSFISPYRESREFVRKQCRNFVEVFVDAPLEVCEKRDAKGLYKKARAGEIKNFTGIDDPYESPLNPDIAVATGSQTVKESFSHLMNTVNRRLR